MGVKWDVYNRGFDEGHKDGFNKAWAANYDKAILEKDLPPSPEEQLDAEWEVCSKKVEVSWTSLLSTWFDFKPLPYPCIVEGGEHHLLKIIDELHC